MKVLVIHRAGMNMRARCGRCARSSVNGCGIYGYRLALEGLKGLAEM